MIKVENITKAYGLNKGVFNLSFNVNQGEAFGFLGPNGAGKTTTIRQLLGFITPDSGKVSIMDLDAFNDAHLIQERLGYIPGEIAFFDHMKGHEFLKLMADLRHLKDDAKMKYLIEFLELDIKGYIKKMSKGMKQKLAIVVAFMHNPDILILDEPTSGLDPLMQNKFVELIKQEKAAGKTILMSSHNFEEIERTCDRALIIKFGQMVALNNIHELKRNQQLVYLVTLKSQEDLEYIEKQSMEIKKVDGLSIEVVVNDVDQFIKTLSKCNVVSLSTKVLSLEEVFLNYYKDEGEVHE